MDKNEITSPLQTRFQALSAQRIAEGWQTCSATLYAEWLAVGKAANAEREALQRFADIDLAKTRNPVAFQDGFDTAMENPWLTDAEAHDVAPKNGRSSWLVGFRLARVTTAPFQVAS